MQVYEIKKAGKWEKVRAKSIYILVTYCKENGYNDWRMLGMQSRIELFENKKIKII